MPGKTFIVDCPDCKAKVAAEEAGCAKDSGFDPEAGEPYGMRLHVGKCPRCNILLAGHSYQTRFAGWEGDDEEVWSDPVRVHPNPPKTFSSYRIPKSVTTSLTEGDIALQGNANLAACVMFGRALEGVCRDSLFTKEEKKEATAGKPKRLMLAQGIKQLRDKNIIDGRLFDWSQHLHAFRNVAAHPDMSGVSISREDAEDLQAFVYAIIEYIYDLTDRYEEFKERQERRAKTKSRARALSSAFGSDD
jgi:hypothetical protein